MAVSPPDCLTAILLILCALSLPGMARAEESKLWGAAGEKWVPGTPLKDFSFAGYKKNDVPIPDFPVGVNVKDFGAVGDGVADDTAAFSRAIAACPANSAVYAPDGTYVIRDWLKISRADIVLRGQSEEKTILFFPVPLQTLHPSLGKTTTGNPTSNYSWSGGLIWFENTDDVGIENFTLKFPDLPYPGHFKETGFNGVYFFKCHDGWARNLTFYNADSGVFAENDDHLTFRHFTFDAYAGRAQANMSGHHGVDFTSSSFCLMDGAVFRNRFLHELGIEHGANMNVYMHSSGPDLHLDHHQPDVHDNLWTDIDAGNGGSVWMNNAHVLLKSRAGSTNNEVFWNVRAAHPFPCPEPKFHNIVVGMRCTAPPAGEVMDGAWYEAIAPEALSPANLFEAQLALRQRAK